MTKFYKGIFEMTKWTEDTARAEVDYMWTVDIRFPGEAFNNNPKAFMRYLTMQARSFRVDGFPIYADAALHIRELVET